MRPMPPPPLPNPELDRFLAAIRRSGLLPPGRVDALASEAPPASARNANKLGEFLVERGILTHFQVSKLKQGTWQGLALGPFHILSPLGKGGMGTVYLAHDTRKPKGRQGLVALKVLPPKRAREEDRMLARFVREMDLAQRVSHPHLTKTYETGDFGGVHFIAMEYIRGMSLRRQVAEHGPLGVPRVARLFAEVADGLQSAHEQGLVHRDLKPSNIMVTPNGHAKVLDMGLALAVGEEVPKDKTIAGGRGYVVGTMDYIAPEQIDNPIGVDARADLYALGCSIYYALAGQPPFPGGTSIEKMKRHRKEFAAPLSDFNPTIPADFSRLVERLMEKAPENRYRSAAAVREALRPWTAGDQERPMDVDPEQTEAEIVMELERTQKDPGEFFESVPVVVFADKGKKTTRQREGIETTEPPGGEEDAKPLPMWLWLIPIAIGLMVLAGGAMALVLYLLKA
jgi:eukaryotic-like serine/threonine-protein kinase